jgi:hypothetical protein
VIRLGGQQLSIHLVRSVAANHRKQNFLIIAIFLNRKPENTRRVPILWQKGDRYNLPSAEHTSPSFCRIRRFRGNDKAGRIESPEFIRGYSGWINRKIKNYKSKSKDVESRECGREFIHNRDGCATSTILDPGSSPA